MLEKLSGKLADLVRQIGGKANISEKNIQDAIDEIKVALLEADVNLRVVRRFVNQTAEEALGAKVVRSVTPGQQFVKVVYDRMVALLGGEHQALALKGPDAVSVDPAGGAAGLGQDDHRGEARAAAEGAGPPAAAGRRRPRASRGGRAARRARGQGGRRRVHRRGHRPVRVVRDAMDHARRSLHDTVIVDTSGRLQVDDEPDGRARADPRRVRARRDAARRGRDDRPERGRHREDLRRARGADRGDPEQVRLGHPGRRGAVDPQRHRAAGEVRRASARSSTASSRSTPSASPRASSGWATW